MHWKEIPGHDELKKQLQESVEKDRIAHAQLFCGDNGFGSLAMALAYARQVLCGDNEKYNRQFDALQHPDLFFSYPIFLSKEKRIEKSKDVLMNWRDFAREKPFGNPIEWSQYLSAENKTLIIGVEEGREIVKNFTLTSFQGAYKVQIVWLAEKMNTAVANKLLKLIEEPPKNSLILLVAEDIENILPTIISRCQTTMIPPFTSNELTAELVKNYHLTEEVAKAVAFKSAGSLNNAVNLSKRTENDFEPHFILWIRSAFLAKKNASALRDLSQWADASNKWGREKQIEFLNYCSQLFRVALLKNYKVNGLHYNPIQTVDFKWDAFCHYVHGGNIEQIMSAIDQATFEIECNTNSKAVMLDLSIQVTRFIHAKETV